LTTVRVGVFENPHDSRFKAEATSSPDHMLSKEPTREGI
jgi:hypothetical protein